MLINSVSHHHVKFQQQNLYSNRKIARYKHSFEPQAIMGKKIAYTRLKLIELSKNHELFTQLVIVHCLFFDKVARPFPHTIDISNPLDSTKAIAQSNLFKQQYFRSIRTFDRLEDELIDGEEGVFSVKLPGLTLTIIMLRAPNQEQTPEKTFIVISSLEKFIGKKNFIYDLNSFTINILDSLRTLLQNKGVWTEQECHAYYKLTGHNTSDLLGSSFPEDLSTRSKFGRTSDFALEEENPMILNKVNGMFQLTNKE